jgi:hypothetical protein
MNKSSGGILVCAEVPFLPCMNLRPFRGDADGIHMNAWAPNGFLVGTAAATLATVLSLFQHGPDSHD